jgi:uncharacterized membrane protein
MHHPGRLVFGLAITGFGVVGLLYVDFLNSLQPMPSWLPGYAPLALVNGAALVAAGAAILVDRRTRLAALGIVVFFLACIAFLHVQSAFTQPALLRSPWWVRTFESVALAGGAATLVGLRSTRDRERWLRGARIAFGLSLPVFGILHLIYARSTATLVPPWYPWPVFWIYFTGVAQIAGGVAIAADVLTRLAAILAGVMYGSWVLTLHTPRVACRLRGPCAFLDGPGGFEASRGEITSLFVAVGMCGAAWLIAGGDPRTRDAAE